MLKQRSCGIYELGMTTREGLVWYGMGGGDLSGRQGKGNVGSSTMHAKYLAHRIARSRIFFASFFSNGIFLAWLANFAIVGLHALLAITSEAEAEAKGERRRKKRDP